MNKRPRLVYDGICNLCVGAVHFLNALRGEGLVEYTPFQKLSAKTLRTYDLSEEALKGRMYLIRRDGSLASGPYALVEVCRLFTPFGFLCNLFKTPAVERIYEWVAKRRYRIFGCRNSCYFVDD
jgi:predicted DCC family thiol-disulfide oxidoreductase YuxK